MRHTTPHELLELAEALRILQRLHVAIIPTARSVVLWSPGIRVSRTVRLTIRKYRAEVRALIDRSDITVCPASSWHRRSWSYVGDQQYRCDLCAQLAPWIGGDATGSKEKKEHA